MADNSVFKSWNKLPGAEDKFMIFSTTALKGFAILFSDKIDNDFVAFFSCSFNSFSLCARFCDAIKNIFYVFTFDGIVFLFSFEFFVIAKFYFWHNIGCNLKFGHFAWYIFCHIDVWGGNWLYFGFGENFWHTALDERIESFGGQCVWIYVLLYYVSGSTTITKARYFNIFSKTPKRLNASWFNIFSVKCCIYNNGARIILNRCLHRRYYNMY